MKFLANISGRSQLIKAALLFATVATYYLLFPPALINGDGIGYIRQLSTHELAPGHLAYLPLLRLLAKLLPSHVSLDLASGLWKLSTCFMLGALFLFYDAARLAHGPRTALYAAGVLGFSHAFSRSAVEIEVYATATFFSVAMLWALLRFSYAPAGTLPKRLWAMGAGFFCGISVLFHLTLILLGIPLLALFITWGKNSAQLPRVDRIHPGPDIDMSSAGKIPPDLSFRSNSIQPQAAKDGRAKQGTGFYGNILSGLGAMSVTLLIPLTLALYHTGHTSFSDAWNWLRSADHGIPSPNLALSPLLGLWGLSRSLIFAPYPHESGWLQVISLTISGISAWSILLWLHFRSKAAPPPIFTKIRGSLCLAWLTPLAVFALYFYPSDTERWIFALPMLLLVFPPPPGKSSVLLLVFVALTNFFSYTLPQASDHSLGDQARAIDAFLQPNDLVIFPGHSWDELLGLSTPQPPERVSFIYYVGAEKSLRRALEQLSQKIDHTFNAGGRVFVLRLKDENDSQGFKELAWFGMSKMDFMQFFAPYHPQHTTLPLLWSLSPPPPASVLQPGSRDSCLRLRQKK